MTSVQVCQQLPKLQDSIMSRTLVIIVREENQSSSIVLHSRFFITKTRLVISFTLQLVTDTVARIFIRHTKFEKDGWSSGAFIGFAKTVFFHKWLPECWCWMISPSLSVSVTIVVTTLKFWANLLCRFCHFAYSHHLYVCICVYVCNQIA